MKKRKHDIDDMEGEVRVDIKWYEGMYQISNMWRVKSMEREINNARWIRIVKERIISQWWYKTSSSVTLHNRWRECKRIAELVASHFLWYEWVWKLFHKNFIGKDNRSSNISITTASKIAKECLRYWKCHKWKMVMWTDKKWNKIFFDSVLQAWKYFLAKEWTNISMCLRWKTKTAYWLEWEYVYEIG